MELNILKIDLDASTRFNAIDIITERLSYIHDLDFFKFENFEKIELLFKTSYAIRIFLKKPLCCEKDIILFQLLLGSDFMKETNTCINHFKLKMEYSNRMFLVKRYRRDKKGNDIMRKAKIENIFEIVKDYINNDKRKFWKN